MKKILFLFSIFTLLFLLSGCVSKEQMQEAGKKVAEIQKGFEGEEEPAAQEEALPEPGSVEVVNFKKLIEFLPEAPAGWGADEPSGTTLTIAEGGSWSSAEGRYDKIDSDEYGNVGIVDSAYYPVGPVMMWSAFFEYESTEGYAKTTEYKGYPAWEVYSKPDRYELYVTLKKRFMVTVGVRSESKDTLYELAGLVDYDGIASLG